MNLNWKANTSFVLTDGFPEVIVSQRQVNFALRQFIRLCPNNRFVSGSEHEDSMWNMWILLFSKGDPPLGLHDSFICQGVSGSSSGDLQANPGGRGGQHRGL